MPSKLIVNLVEQHHADNRIAIEREGEVTELKHVRRIVIDSGDAQSGDSPIAEITMWAMAQKTAIVVSDQTAEAVLRVDADRIFSFLTPEECAELERWFGASRTEDESFGAAAQHMSAFTISALSKVMQEIGKSQRSEGPR